MSEPTRERNILLAVSAAVVALAALDAAWMGWSALPCPRGDDAFYKSPAAELVQHGHLAQPAVTGYLPRAEEVFAAYPPFYQLAVAGWFKVFGINVWSGVAFGHVIHLLNMIAVMVLVAVVLKPHAMPVGLRALTVCASGLLFFGILRFFDRQEELAVLWCWLEMILYQRGMLTGFRGAVISGVLLGICGMVSPWTGLVFALILTLRAVVDAARQPGSLGRQIARLLLTAVVAALPVAAWVVWLESNHPHIIREQFLEHIRISEKSPLREAPTRLINTLLYSPYQLPALLFTLLFFPRLLTASARPQTPTVLLSLFGGAAAALALSGAFRANSYNYVWLCLILLIPCFGYLAGRLLAEGQPSERFILGFIVVMCTAMSFRDPVSLSLIAHDLPAEERPSHVYELLDKQIPKGELVATTSRYWYVFQGRNPWRDSMTRQAIEMKRGDLEHLPSEWQWIVMQADYADDDPDFQHQLNEDYELVQQTPSTYHTWAPSFHLQDRTWACKVYRRKP